MAKRKAPTIAQANIMFFITAVVTLAGSVFFQPRLGIGTNLWINEFVYILFPPLLMAWINGWPIENVYRFRKISAKSKLISILSGFAIWPMAFTVSRITRMLLDNKIGVIESSGSLKLSIYQSLLIMIGTVILAPICEEIFFRGFVQRAYESRGNKQGFVIAALLFGFYHILNGISEVIPACILGLCLGFLVYRTGSLASSMLFHGTANLCAVLFGGVLAVHTSETIPAWLYIVALAGLCISVALLKSIREEAHDPEDNEEADRDKKTTAAGILFLVLTAVYLAVVGVFEIIGRLGIV